MGLIFFAKSSVRHPYNERAEKFSVAPRILCTGRQDAWKLVFHVPNNLNVPDRICVTLNVINEKAALFPTQVFFMNLSRRRAIKKWLGFQDPCNCPGFAGLDSMRW